MRQRSLMMRCTNCGTEFSPAGPLEFDSEQAVWYAVCPVCEFHTPASATGRQPSMTLATCASALHALVARARAGGLRDAQLVTLLRDELEFVAELAQQGRRLSVQIIDLGVQHTERTGAALPDRRELLQTHVIGSSDDAAARRALASQS